MAGADRPDQAFEAGPRDPAAGTSEIVVNDLDRGPAERASAIGEAILATATLMVVQELVGRRLANVNVGPAPQMLTGDLAHCRPPLRASRRSRQEGLPPASPVGPSAPEPVKCAVLPR